jgi:hypothetical protein
MSGSGRVFTFWVEIGWLVLLGALAVVFLSEPRIIPLRDNLGSVPLGVIWFGALGGVMISLTGIVSEHRKDWDESFALWHFSRPLVGAGLGVVAVLIVQAGVLSAGSAPSDNTQVPKNLLYYLVAFLVGYREETFRELIKRLVDLILAPGTPSPAPTINGVTPTSGPLAGKVPVVISGSGFTDTKAVTFATSAAAFRVDSDSQITAQLPSASAAGQVTVTVEGKTGSATASFSYS